jgi:uncharacterized membrane protein
MAVETSGASRLAYIDWMRGLACVMMFQTHCYDSWLGPEARKSELLKWSQLGGTLPAPIFVFLAGVSFALVTDKLRGKGIARDAVARQTIRRGAEIFGLGLLFRIQEFALGYPWAPWTDLLRVDVLNILGLSMMLMGGLCWLAAGARSGTGASTEVSVLGGLRAQSITAALVVAGAVAIMTPALWTTHRPDFLPWPLESYINGVHTFGVPQPWLFPVFPWSAFAFAGLAVGFVLVSDFARRRQSLAIALIGVCGALACGLSVVLDRAPVQLYAVYDYWHTSPNFFLMRCGILLLLVFAIFAWCKWGLALKGFSPVLQLGTTSLLVYWVHIEFVYGRFSILPKRGCSIGRATLGLATIFIAMVILSILRTRWKRSRRAVPAPMPVTAETA